MSNRKFMIVKPTLCCGNAASVGDVGIYFGRIEKQVRSCIYCKHEFEPLNAVKGKFGDGYFSVEESRIIWLPDDEDVLSFDKENELERV